MNTKNELLHTIKRIAEMIKLMNDEIDVLHRQIEELTKED